MPSHVPYAALRCVLLAGALAVAAPAQKVVIDYDRAVDFSVYKKYEWKEHPFLMKNPESRQFTVGAQLVQSKVNEILLSRGYEPVDGQPPEFYLTHFITARMRQEVSYTPVAATFVGGYTWPGSWYSWASTFPAWESYIENYAEGFLLLDVVDAKTNRLLWRAACKAKIDEMRERHKEVESAVKKALSSFPPKPRR
jgi:hypothetical protein